MRIIIICIENHSYLAIQDLPGLEELYYLPRLIKYLPGNYQSYSTLLNDNLLPGNQAVRLTRWLTRLTRWLTRLTRWLTR